jgi:hypothetical protein
MSFKATAAALVTAANDLIPMVWHQGALLPDMQCDHVKFQQDTLPVLTLMVCWCNTTLEELQRDQVKLRQTIGNINNHVISPTMPPLPVVMGTSTNIGSSACNQPRNTVLVGRDDESSTPVELRQPPRDDVAGDGEEAWGTTHVRHPPPRETVSFGHKGGPVAKEFVLFHHRDRTGAPRDLGATAMDNCSHSPHPVFPQEDPSTFNDLAERDHAHVNDDTYANNRGTDPTT